MLRRNDGFQAIVSPPAALRGTGGPGEQPVTTRETPAGATLLRFSAGSQGVHTTTYPLKQKSMA